MRRSLMLIGTCALLAACVAHPSAGDRLSGSIILVVIGVIVLLIVAVAISRSMRGLDKDNQHPGEAERSDQDEKSSNT